MTQELADRPRRGGCGEGLFRKKRRRRAALEVVTRYFDCDRLLPKTRLVLEELLGG